MNDLVECQDCMIWGQCTYQDKVKLTARDGGCRYRKGRDVQVEKETTVMW
jgi:hypothetical protein